jgi:glycosyltransferase involved in cell wall biosynthesis
VALLLKVSQSNYQGGISTVIMIKVILISSVKPNPSSAGEMLLYRHLVDNDDIDLLVVNCEPRKAGVRQFLRKFHASLYRTIFRRFAADLMVLWKGRWIDTDLPALVDSKVLTVVMTVAHGDAFHAAMRYADKYKLPLVTFFHDWWPDIANAHKPFRPITEHSFRSLYAKSDLALCVSQGMMKKLGPHTNSRVLLPIPATVDHEKTKVVRPDDRPFRLLYAGNLREYGPMIIEALKLLKNHPDIRLEVRGNSISWPAPMREEMANLGLLLPFVPRDEIAEWLESADAYLITQSFSQIDQHLMKTNFPSKLPEFAQLGKPLIIWGPAEASGPKWARESGQALVVDQVDPKCLEAAIEELSTNKDEQNRLASAASEAASKDFNPEHIQSNFMQWIKEVAVQ